MTSQPFFFTWNLRVNVEDYFFLGGREGDWKVGGKYDIIFRNLLSHKNLNFLLKLPDLNL